MILFCFVLKERQGREGNRKAERGKREAGGKRGWEGGKNQPGDFLAVKKALSPSQGDEAHQTLQTTATNSSGSTNNASYSGLQSEAHYLVHSGEMFLTAGASHPKTGHSLEGVRVAVLKAPGFGCSQSSVLFTVILGVLLICVL